MRTTKRLVTSLLICLLLCPLGHASGQEPARVPWRKYSTLESKHERVVLYVQYTNEKAERCVIRVGEGTVALELTDGLSFSWDAKSREVSMTWTDERLEFSVDYKPAMASEELAGGAAYEDALLFTYYAADGATLHQDRVTITGAHNGMLVDMEPVKGPQTAER